MRVLYVTFIQLKGENALFAESLLILYTLIPIVLPKMLVCLSNSLNAQLKVQLKLCLALLCMGIPHVMSFYSFRVLC